LVEIGLEDVFVEGQQVLKHLKRKRKKKKNSEIRSRGLVDIYMRR